MSDSNNSNNNPATTDVIPMEGSVKIGDESFPLEMVKKPARKKRDGSMGSETFYFRPRIGTAQAALQLVAGLIVQAESSKADSGIELVHALLKAHYEDATSAAYRTNDDGDQFLEEADYSTSLTTTAKRGGTKIADLRAQHTALITETMAWLPLMEKAASTPEGGTIAVPFRFENGQPVEDSYKEVEISEFWVLVHERQNTISRLSEKIMEVDKRMEAAAAKRAAKKAAKEQAPVEPAH